MCVKPLKYALCPCMYISLLLLALLTLSRLHSLCSIKRAASPSNFSSKEEKLSLFLQILATLIICSMNLVVVQLETDELVLFKVNRKGHAVV